MKVDTNRSRDAPKDDGRVSIAQWAKFVVVWLGMSLFIFWFLVQHPYSLADSAEDSDEIVPALFVALLYYALVPGDFNSLLGILQGLILFIIIAGILFFVSLTIGFGVEKETCDY